MASPSPDRPASILPAAGEMLAALQVSLDEVFASMLAMNGSTEGDSDLPSEVPAPLPVLDVEATVGFHGEVDGCVVLHCSDTVAANIARAMLMLGPDEPLHDDDVADAMGECANMVTGSFKTNVLDPAATFQLGLPQVRRPSAGLSEVRPGMLVYRLDGEYLWAEIWIQNDAA